MGPKNDGKREAIMFYARQCITPPKIFGVQLLLDQNFFSSKIGFYVWSFGANAPPKVFFVYGIIGHTKTNILDSFRYYRTLMPYIYLKG